LGPLLLCPFTSRDFHLYINTYIIHAYIAYIHTYKSYIHSYMHTYIQAYTNIHIYTILHT